MASARTPAAPAATPKGQRWADTLDHARRLALFSHPHPGLAKGGVNAAAIGQAGPKTAAAVVDAGGASGAAQGGDARALGFAEWKEVLRKFRKHNPAREGEFWRWLERVLASSLPTRRHAPHRG